MGRRGYGVAGCLIVALLPLSLLAAWIDGTLTWANAIGWGLAATGVVTVPLLLAGRRP